MTQLAARLAMLLLMALAVRAATGQQFAPPPSGRGDPYAPPPAAAPAGQTGPQRYPIYVPPPAFRFGSSGPSTVTPPADPSVRYPLPTRPAVAPPPVPSPQPPAPASPPTISVPQANQGSDPPTPTGNLFQPAQIVATVGDKFIFYGDVAPTVNQMLEPALAKAASDLERQEIEKYREPLTRQTVKQIVETKIMFLEFERDIIKNAPKDKLAEVRKNIDKRIAESFEQELAAMRIKIAQAKKEEIPELLRKDPIAPRLALLMRDNNAESLGELDAILRRYGSTLEKQVRYYGEYKLGRSTVGKHINFKPEVTHQEMLDYYRDHAANYAMPAKARFEILTAKFSNYASPADAERAVAAMGNEVFFGTPFAAVAGRSSQEPNAKSGGVYDWTSQGSLASEPIDQALFSLEVGKLSQIITDDRGCHILRVIERQPAGQVAFVEAQKAIKDAIVIQKKEADYKKFVQQLSTGTQIWTIYDEPADKATARQPAQTAPR